MVVGELSQAPVHAPRRELPSVDSVTTASVKGPKGASDGMVGESERERDKNLRE